MIESNFQWLYLFYHLAEKAVYEGIPVVPFKGASFLIDGCADVSVRPMADLDILVRPEDFAKCRGVLEDLGYRLEGPLLRGVLLDQGRECLFVGPEGRQIDVHYRFFQRHLEEWMLGFDSQEAVRRACAEEWKGLTIYRLRKEDELFHLLAAACFEPARAEHFLRDADALARVHADHIDWETLAGFIRKSPMRSWLEGAAGSARTQYGTPFSRTLTTEENSSFRREILDEKPSDWRSRRLRWRFCGGLRAKAAFLALALGWRLFLKTGWFRAYFMRRNNPVFSYFVDSPV